MTGGARYVLLTVSGCVLVFLLAPFLFVVVGSLGADAVITFPPRSLTLHWYTQISPEFIRAFGVSLLLAAISSVLSIMLAFPAALGLVRGQFGGKAAVQALLRAPLQVPQLVIGVAFLQFYRLAEDVNDMRLTGSFIGLVLAHLCFTVPYAISALSAALAKTNLHVEEAAYSLGASRWSTLRRVTLPSIRQGISAAMFFAFITSFENVPVSLFLVGSGVTTLPIMIFEEVQFAFSPIILAVSTIVVVASTVLILLVQRFAGLSPNSDQAD